MTLLVVDASAVVEFVLATPAGHLIASRIADRDARLHIPHVCGAEVTSALRGLALGKKISVLQADRARDAFLLLVARRHPIEPFVSRIWELRSNLTVYDATYVTLAEALGTPLVTCDAKFDTPTVTRLINVEVVG